MLRPVERVRGFYDVEYSSYVHLAATLKGLTDVFEGHGFPMVDVPVLEQQELYLRKNGAQVLSKLYTFVDQGNRQVALRPEFTASIIRAFASQINPARGPLRVSYAGPVFRYEKPQRATMRQFTQAGVELLGEAGKTADADLLAMACEAARAQGVERLRLVLGHLGPLRALLAHLQVHGYAEEYLLEHLEFYSRGRAQRDAVRRRLGLDGAGPDEEESLPEGLAAAVHNLGHEEARAMVGTLLQQMGFELGGSTRTPEEIVDRVLVKARRQSELQRGTRRESLERTLQFLELLGNLRGAPDEVMPEAEHLLAEYGVPPSTLDDLRAILYQLDAHDLRGVTIDLAPGMARGIAYYSGLMFELYADTAAEDPQDMGLQICGGGRYDGLARALTGRSGFPALGFSFGVERLLHAVPSAPSAANSRPRVVVLVEDPSARSEAHRLARQLRADDVVCVVQDSEVGANRALKQARSAGYDAALRVPPPPGATGGGRGGVITWRDDVRLERALEHLPGGSPQDGAFVVGMAGTGAQSQ